MSASRTPQVVLSANAREMLGDVYASCGTDLPHDADTRVWRLIEQGHPPVVALRVMLQGVSEMATVIAPARCRCLTCHRLHRCDEPARQCPCSRCGAVAVETL